MGGRDNDYVLFSCLWHFARPESRKRSNQACLLVHSHVVTSSTVNRWFTSLLTALVDLSGPWLAGYQLHSEYCHAYRGVHSNGTQLHSAITCRCHTHTLHAHKQRCVVHRCHLYPCPRHHHKQHHHQTPCWLLHPISSRQLLLHSTTSAVGS